MRPAKVMASIGALVMAVMILRAIFTGDFSSEGAELIRGPWGQLSLVDVYVGFLIFAGWVIFRERSLLRAVLWIAALLFLGNLVSCLYVLFALQDSGGDWHRFWFGQRVADS